MQNNSTDSFLTVGAQFYDLIQRDVLLHRAALVAQQLEAPPTMLDLGAGTGVISLALADAWPTAHVHAVEPSRPMRTALLTSLAARPDLLARVTVHPQALPDVELRAPVDLVTSFWVMHAVNEPDWSHTLDAVTAALTPGGHFLVETPDDDARRGVNEWENEISLGPHTLSYVSRFEHRDDGSVNGQFSYIWRDEDGHVLYTDVDHSHHGPQPARHLGEALAARGFTEERRFDDVQASRTGATLSVFRLG